MTTMKNKQLMSNRSSDESTSNSKSVRINDVPEDLERRHAERLGLKLRRMKRKLLLDAVSQDSLRSSARSLNLSTSSLPRDGGRDDDDNDSSSENGEAAFQRGRQVRYHSGSASLIFDSTGTLNELSNHDNDNRTPLQRRNKFLNLSRGRV